MLKRSHIILMILMIFAISSLTAVSATDIENNTVYETNIITLM